MSLLSDVAAVSEKADREIRTNAETRIQKPVGKFIESILDYPEEIVREALGEIGVNIRNFIAAVDMTHPDLVDIADGTLAETEFSRLAVELLDLTSYAKTKCLSMATKYFPKMIGKADGHNVAALRISDPSKNSCSLIRFIKSPQKREALRSRRNPSNISIQGPKYKHQDSWDLAPVSFEGFVRNSSPDGDEIEKCNRRLEHCRSLGLEHFSAKIADRIESLVAFKKEQYYGFNRCKVDLATITLAKVHGFTFKKPSLGDRTNAASIRSGGFPHLVNTANFNSPPGLDYQPRLYPITQFRRYPERMVDLIAHLEAFPEAGGRPIFDHYGVLVPSIWNASSTVSTLSPNAKCAEFDEAMIADKVVVPILLGEKDGRIYFVNYWS